MSQSEKLSKEERHNLITTELNQSPAIRVSQLASAIGVSTETIRRDLAELEKKGLISRTYGGAAKPLTPDPEYKQRDKTFGPERGRIAKYAVDLIQDGQVIIIGSSTTTVHVATRIAAQKKNLTVFTDSIIVASKLSTNPTIKTHLCPGIYKEEEFCVYGAETVDYLSKVYANHAILGATGLTGSGVSNADIDIAQTYKIMAERASNVMIVADHSKIGKTAISTYASWDHIDTLITDIDPADEDLMSGLRLNKVNIIVSNI